MVHFASVTPPLIDLSLRSHLTLVLRPSVFETCMQTLRAPFTGLPANTCSLNRLKNSNALGFLERSSYQWLRILTCQHSGPNRQHSGVLRFYVYTQCVQPSRWVMASSVGGFLLIIPITFRRAFIVVGHSQIHEASLDRCHVFWSLLHTIIVAAASVLFCTLDCQSQNASTIRECLFAKPHMMKYVFSRGCEHLETIITANGVGILAPIMHDELIHNRVLAGAKAKHNSYWYSKRLVACVSENNRRRWTRHYSTHPLSFSATACDSLSSI